MASKLSPTPYRIQKCAYLSVLFGPPTSYPIICKKQGKYTIVLVKSKKKMIFKTTDEIVKQIKRKYLYSIYIIY